MSWTDSDDVIVGPVTLRVVAVSAKLGQQTDATQCTKLDGWGLVCEYVPGIAITSMRLGLYDITHLASGAKMYGPRLTTEEATRLLLDVGTVCRVYHVDANQDGEAFIKAYLDSFTEMAPRGLFEDFSTVGQWHAAVKSRDESNRANIAYCDQMVAESFARIQEV